MKKIFILASLAFVIASCGSAPLENGTPVADITAIEADAANTGKRLSIEGYLCTPELIDGMSGQIETMGIYTEPAGEGKYLGSLPIAYGSSKNSFRVGGDNFSDEDIIYTDNDGVEHTYNVKAVYSFTANYANNDWSYTDVRIDAVL